MLIYTMNIQEGPAVCKNPNLVITDEPLLRLVSCGNSGKNDPRGVHIQHYLLIDQLTGLPGTWTSVAGTGRKLLAPKEAPVPLRPFLLPTLLYC